MVYRAPQIPAVLKGHKYCLHLPSPCRVQRLLWPVAKRTSQTMGCWTDFCMHWSNRGLRSCGTHPNRQKQTPQRPDHVPPHSGSTSSSASLPAEVSHVVKNQLHVARLHVWVEEPSALDFDTAPHPPGWPPSRDAPAGAASRLPSQQPKRLRDDARGTSCCSITSAPTPAGCFPTPCTLLSRCHDPGRRQHF